MSGATSHAAEPPPLHSVFISYSSADRAAARALRDTLTAAGLEVWLDEDELAGGEAWDAKIRNQIRTCTYFMPVISASTETRREGYFRREWRLAVERTLDLADDVMFLVPVVIDDTRDAGARVPEKFFTVQWLRVPGGRATPELEELARKLARGDAVAVEAPPATVSASKARKSTEPPPFPRFPDYPEPGNRSRFLYDLVIWFGRLLYAFWGHLPRWLRVVAACVIVFNVIGLFTGRDKEPATRKPRTEKIQAAEEAEKALFEVGKEATRQNRNRPAPPILESLVNAAEGLQGARALAVVTFNGESPAAGDYAGKLFQAYFEHAVGESSRPSLSPIPFATEPNEMDCLERGARMKSRFVLTGYARAQEGQPAVLTVRLFDVRQRAFVWTATFDAATEAPKPAAARLYRELAPHLRPAPEAPDAPPPPK
jgi:hypothetical protein